jgi:transposase
MIRKGQRELQSGLTCVDAVRLRGRKRSEERLPSLLEDVRAVVDGQSQTDPQFKTNRLYTRLSAGEVRRQLIEKRGYGDEELPTERTISTLLNRLGYSLQKVRKTKPQKN